MYNDLRDKSEKPGEEKFKASETLSEQIARHLSDRIIKMEIRPGERLVEARIAEELGVSQSPVREALRILEKIKFVKLVPRHGTRVTEVTEDVVGSIYDIFIELVGLATLKTVQRRTDDDVHSINAALERVDRYAQAHDVFNFNEAFFSWGVTCLKAARDPLLEEMLVDLVPTMRRILYQSLLRSEHDEMKGVVKKMAYSTQCIEKGLADEAVRNNRAYLETEKQKALASYRKAK